MATEKTIKIKIVTNLSGDDAFKKLGQTIDKDTVSISKFDTTLRKTKGGLDQYIHSINLTAKELDNLRVAELQAATALSSKKYTSTKYAFENPLKDFKKEQKDRLDIFQTGLKEAEAKLKSSIARQKAIAEEGTNSITAFKLAQAEKERQIQVKLAKDLSEIQKRFLAGESNWMQQAKERNIALQAYEQKILNLNSTTRERISVLQDLIAKEKEANRIANLSFGDRMASGAAPASRNRKDAISIGMSNAGRSAIDQATLAQTRYRDTQALINALLRQSVNNVKELTGEHKSLLAHVAEIYSIYSLINIAAQYTKQALLNIPKAGIEQQTTQASIFGIFGTSEGLKNLQFLQDIAGKAGQSVLVLEQAYRRYAPSAALAGASQDEINKSFRDFAEVGNILHLPEDRLNSLFLALDQMFAKGVVQSEEIKKQLGNVLPGAVEIGAKAMGKSPAAFMDAMKKNEITAKEFVPKFAAMYRKIFGGDNDQVFLRTSDQFFSNLQRIKNQYEVFNRQMFNLSEEWLNSVVRGIGNGIKSLNKNLNGILQVGGAVVTLIGVKLVAALTAATTKTVLATAANLVYAGSLARMGNMIGPPNVKAVSSWEYLKNLFTGIVGLAPRLLAFTASTLGITGLAAGLSTILLKIGGVNLQYERLINTSKTEINQLMARYAAGDEEAGKQLENIARLQEASKSFILEFKGNQIQISSLLEAAWNRVKLGAKASWEVISKISSSVYDSVKNYLNIWISDLKIAFTDLGKFIYERIVNAVSTAIASVRGAGSFITEFFDTGSIDKAKNAFEQTSTQSKVTASNAIKSVTKEASDSFGLISSKVNEVSLEMMSRAGKTVKAGVNTLMTDAVQLERAKQEALRKKQIDIAKLDDLGNVDLSDAGLDDKAKKAQAKAAEQAASLEMTKLKARLSELKEATDTEVKYHKDVIDKLNYLKEAKKITLTDYYAGAIAEVKAGLAAQEQGINERIATISNELGSLGGSKNDPKRRVELNKLLKLAEEELNQTRLQTSKELRDIDEQQITLLNSITGKTETVAEKYKKLFDQLNQLKNSKTSDGKSFLSDEQYTSAAKSLDFNRRVDLAQERDAEPRQLPGLKKYNDLIKEINSNTQDLKATNAGTFDAALGGINTLAGAFDDLGESLDRYSALQEELNSKKKNALLDLEGDNTAEALDKRFKLEQDYSKASRKLDTDRFKDSLGGFARMTSAAESFFSKQSTGAKAFHNLTIALSVAKMAMDVKERASTIATMAADMAGGVAKMFQQSGWLGFAGAAAFLALMASLGFGKGSGGNVSIPSDSGTTGTVLGDQTASSQSLNNVVKILEDIHAKEYRELIGINAGVTTMAAGIQNAVASIFRGNDLQIKGTFGQKNNVPNIDITPFFNKISEKINGFLFGSKKVELKAVGIETVATKLTEAMQSGVQAFQFQIDTITKKGALGGLFGGNKKYDVQTNSPLSEETSNTLNAIFKSAGQTIFEASKIFNNIFDDAINNYILPALKVDLKDLKGEDAVKKLQEAISTLLDTTAGEIFNSLKQYQKLGEGMFETVSRVATDLAVVRDSFNMTRVGFKAFGLEAIAIAEAIVTASGDIQKARANFQEFFDKFFMSGEQQVYTLNNLQGMLQDMGLILPETRDGWKALTQAMLAGGVATANTAGRLLELSKTADEYYKSIEKGQQNEKGITSGGLQVIDKFTESLNYILLKFVRVFNEMSIDPSRTWAGFNEKMVEVVDAGTNAFNEALANLDKVSESIYKNIIDKTAAIADLMTTIRINTYSTLEQAKLSGDLNSSDWNKQFAAQRKLESIRENVRKAENALAERQIARYREELNREIAGESIQDKYNRQAGAIDKIQSALQTRYDKELSLLNNIITSISGIQTHVRDLLADSNLSPLSNTGIFNQSQEKFYATLNAAKGGDQTALSNFNSVMDDYLGKARDYYASSEQYSEIFNRITNEALGLQDLALSTEQKIESNTSKMLSELQTLQLKLDYLEISRQETSLADREALTKTYQDIAGLFFSTVQTLVDKAAPGGNVDVAASYGSGRSSSYTPFSTVQSKLLEEDIAKFNGLFVASEYYKAASFALGKGYSKQAIAEFIATTYNIPMANTLSWFQANGFAKGGTFTNGVVSRPTTFNMGLMGESGSEGILPLRNINGTLGVHAVVGGDKELVNEVRALREENKVLREEMKLHFGNLIISTYDASEKNANTISNSTSTSTDKLIFNKRNQPELV